MALWTPTRRTVQAAGLSLGVTGGLLTPRPARALSSSQRKFIVLQAVGGWDTTRVLAPGFDHDIVDMESDAELAEAGDLRFVSHPNRPQVDEFFQTYADRTAFLQGMIVPSIAHEACFVLTMTGEPSDDGADWPSILGADVASDYVAPNLVLGGPSFPGPNLASVVQIGSQGQLGDLLEGTYRGWDEAAVGSKLSLPSRQRIDTFIRGRAASMHAADYPGQAGDLTEALSLALQQADGMKGQRHQMDFASVAVLDDAIRIAADALALGLTRAVTLASPANGEHGWDSHTTNDDKQNVLFGDLFDNLNTLLFLLETYPGEHGGTLLDETTVVVLSEMGRTPFLNNGGGKDHWPFTSVMLIGSGIQGGATAGAYDDRWFGAAAEDDLEGPAFECGDLGATLLALGDIDPGDHTTGSPIEALMA